MVLRKVTHNNDKGRYSKKRFVFAEWKISVPKVPTEGRKETTDWVIKGGACRNINSYCSQASKELPG